MADRREIQRISEENGFYNILTDSSGFSLPINSTTKKLKPGDRITVFHSRFPMIDIIYDSQGRLVHENPKTASPPKAYKVIDFLIEQLYKGDSELNTLIVGPTILDRDPVPLYILRALKDREGKVNLIYERHNSGTALLSKTQLLNEASKHKSYTRKIKHLFYDGVEEMVRNAAGSVDLLFDHKALSYVANYRNFESGADPDSDREAEEEVVKIYDKLLTDKGTMVLMDLHPLDSDTSPVTPPNLGQHVIPLLKKKGYRVLIYKINDRAYPTEAFRLSEDKERIFCNVAVLAMKNKCLWSNCA